MKKRNNATREDQPLVPEETRIDEGLRGVRWQRYAGVGPVRKSAGQLPGKISGSTVTSLGSLEAELMGILWQIGRPANGMEVAEAALYRRRSLGQEPDAFATVNTTLRRLADKGILVSEKHETRTPYYTPTVGREEMAGRILNNVSVTLLGQTLYGLLPRLTGNLRQPKDPEAAAEQEHLRRLLQALEDAADKDTVSPEADPE